eukprot:515152-Rhodomonas_salina.1
MSNSWLTQLLPTQPWPVSTQANPPRNRGRRMDNTRAAEESGQHEQERGFVPFVIQGRPSVHVEVGYGGAVGEEVEEGNPVGVEPTEGSGDEGEE